ncbi:MAG: hypothetical protein PHI96_06050 [Desulfovibrio sp.]|nr:hypothetical protein [Desulfovibrio sp.]
MKQTATALWRHMQCLLHTNKPSLAPVRTKVRARFGLTVALCLALVLCLGACAPQERRPLTFEEQQDLDAYWQCRREATSMNPEWRGDSSYFPWRAYFDMCMRRMGVSDQQMRRMNVW